MDIYVEDELGKKRLVKYALHPGKLLVRDKDSKISTKYFTAFDICRIHDVREYECVVWDGKKHRGTMVENLKHLRPFEPKGPEDLPEYEDE